MSSLRSHEGMQSLHSFWQPDKNFPRNLSHILNNCQELLVECYTSPRIHQS